VTHSYESLFILLRRFLLLICCFFFLFSLALLLLPLFFVGGWFGSWSFSALVVLSSSWWLVVRCWWLFFLSSSWSPSRLVHPSPYVFALYCCVLVRVACAHRWFFVSVVHDFYFLKPIRIVNLYVFFIIFFESIYTKFGFVGL